MAKKSKSETVFEGQHDDEEVLLLFRRHPVILRRPLIAFLVIITLSAVPPLFTAELKDFNYMFVGLFFGGAIFGYYWIGWFYSYYLVTNQRFIQVKRRGFFNTQVVELGLDKIQNINYEVIGLQETLLGYGTITIQTFVGDLILSTVSHPATIHRQLTDILKEISPDYSQV